MSFAPQDAKERVRQAIDIVDLLGRYLTLRRQGQHFVAICPWHDDSRPSLHINQARQSWKCWVCDVGGDVFSFVMKYERVEFREALQMLADRAGIELASTPVVKAKPGSPDDKTTLLAAVAWAEQQFHDCLLRSSQAEPARRYLAERGISPASIERFRLGFSPDSWQWLQDRARSTNFTTPVLLASGLIAKSPNSGSCYDWLKGRVIFPIHDVQDRPIAFGGRVLPEQARPEQAGRTPAKYINSPETRVYSKSEHLYGLSVGRPAIVKTKQVVVMEGYTDVILAQQHGIDQAVAVQGVALNERHLRLLRRFVESVTLVLDGDDAGQRRTNDILQLFVAAQLDLRILTLPNGLDPCDFVIQHGGDAFRQLLAGAVDALEHKFRTATEGIDLASDTHRASRAVEEILSTIAKAPRLQSSTTESIRIREQQILGRVARQFRLPEEEVRKRLAELRKGIKPSRSPEAPTAQPTISQLTTHEQELFEILVLHPELVPVAIERIGVEDMSGPLARLLLSTYLELEVAGETLDFPRVLTEVEDAQLKNILVELDERAQRKAALAEESAMARLNGLIRDFAWERAAHASRDKVVALEEQRLNNQEELDLLTELIQQERERQGISMPTDGYDL